MTVCALSDWCMLDTTLPAVDNAAPSYITFRPDQVCLRSKFERLLAQSDQHFNRLTAAARSMRIGF